MVRVPTLEEGDKLPENFLPVDADFDNLSSGVTFALPGGATGNLRLPVNGGVTIDGSSLPPKGVTNGDKVAYAFSSTFKGGFLAEDGGTAKFAWGANDFVTTGKTAGDVDGLDTITGREIEVHLYTPDANVATGMKALQLDCKVESTATDAHIDTLMGLYITAMASDAVGSTVDESYGIYVEAPTVGTIKYGMYVNGNVKVVGDSYLQGSNTLRGNLSHEAGYAKFTGAVSAAQGISVGTYVGNSSGIPSVTFADGVNTWSIDMSSAELRFMKTGVSQAAKLDFSGNLTLSGSINMSDNRNIVAGSVSGLKIGTATTQKLGFFNKAPVVQPSGTPVAAVDAATTQTLVNDIRSKLISLGLIA